METLDAVRVAEVLHASRENLIASWARNVLADPSVPRAREISHPQLIDHMPELLDEIVAALSGSAEAAHGSRRHGETRAVEGYDVAQVVRELGHFREAILDTLHLHGAYLVWPTATIVHRCIDRSVASAVDRMAEVSARAIASERDIARRANESKGEFLALMSHEVRNRLNAILGWSRMARRGDPELTARALEVVERNANLIEALVDDVIDLRRAAEGKLRLQSVPLDLRRAAAAAVESALPRAEERGVEIEVEPGEREAIICGDPARVDQLITNLVDNALKFTAAGGHVRVRVARRAECAELAVEDDGAGIEPGVIDGIFEPFRQAESADTGRASGLGLGLALVAAIVRGHGGTIRAASAGAGKGTTFIVALPLGTAECG
jgi:signal transduction histidine kinase